VSGRFTTQTFDQLNRLSTHKDAAQNLSSIKYDSHSRPLTITDPRSNVTSYVYDGFGDTIQQTSPDTLKTIYFYDPDRNQTGKIQAGINFSSATYDAIDRILTRTYRPRIQGHPRRWVVERSIGWLTQYRRPVRDYEQRLDVSEAMIFLAMGNLLLRRITHP
jgi:YD repeat-containing protein